MKSLMIHPVVTRILRQRESLLSFVLESLPPALIHEGMIVAVTSKIVSLAEGRVVPKDGVDKKNLVMNEADRFLGEIGHGCFLTVKEGLLIPSAGIDESNSEDGGYILYPEDPFLSAEKLWRGLKEGWGINRLGVLLTDSHTSPLRRGVTGIALSWFGFHPTRNMIGTKDLFGRELRMTMINQADGLAVAAVLGMGEGAESRPLAVIENSGVMFADSDTKAELQIPLEHDLYFPILKPLLD